METRKITIANSRDQKKSIIMTAATTLGELKRDLDNAGINYYDMDFIEALTKTQLRGDDSVLPHDVPYNHTTTNELVFLLTTPNRKIKSGSRDGVYRAINNAVDSSDIKQAIKDKFGRNYTMVGTSDLETFVEEWQHFHNPNEFKPKDVTPAATLESRVDTLEQKVDNLTEAMFELIDILEPDYCTEDVYNALTKDIRVKDNTVYSAGMNADEIDDLVASAID